MQTLTRGLLSRRKIVIIFILAILIPALVLGYMSLSAFSKRREAVGQLLRSNLWMSGESALRDVEDALLELEKNILLAPPPAELAALNASIPAANPSMNVFPAGTANTHETYFLLDGDFRILIPRTGSEKPPFFTGAKDTTENEFSRIFKRAETYEFSRREFARAAQLYTEALAMASSSQQKATAMASLGRCLSSAGNFKEAGRVYGELGGKYGSIRDPAGHFFGITAPVQIYEIEKRQQGDKNPQTLLNLYQDLKNGKWPISLAEYEFFTTEIESIIEADIGENKFTEKENYYHYLKQSPSPYLQSLLFAEFLTKNVVPEIRERIGAPSLDNSWQPESEHLPVSRRGQYSLISYSPFQDPEDLKTYYRGFYWPPEWLKNEIFPKILERVSQETGLELENIEENDTTTSSGSEESTSGNSLVLAYRQFPLPWKLHVIQPELDALRQTAQRENFLYGGLLAFITVLMFFGAFLLGRDISRESETTRLKMDFVHNISHELKTPLTLIRLYGETLQRKKNLPEKDRNESYEIITKESERLSHLINNVLDFSRIELGRKEFKFRSESLSQVVRETLDSYRYHLEKNGFEVKSDIDPDLPEMSFDAEAVASILVNLLSNAMKFSSDTKKITVRLFRRNRWAVLQVEDKGIGIAKQDQGKIFNKFYRVKLGDALQAQGSGLGLTLVKHIAEAHGGTMEVESEPGNGSVFSILLPLPGPDEDRMT
jgi:signal transduction histidine kinase